MEIGPLVTRDVVSVQMTDSLRAAARAMQEHNVGSAVVTGGESPGIITERDLLRAIASGDLDTASVQDYMSRNAVSASPSWGVEEAAHTMIDGGFRHLVIVGQDGQPSGILSIRDLVKALLDQRS